MRSTAFVFGFAGLTAAACLGIAAPAEAEPPGFALNRFQPPFAGDRFFGVESPYAATAEIGDRFAVHGMVLVDYAHDPLVVRGQSSDRLVGAIVGNQATVHLNASVIVLRRLTLNLDAPFAFQSGDAPQASGVSFSAPPGVAVGDLRLAARYSIWGDYFDPFQIAVSAALWFPTGSRSAYLSDGSVRGAPRIVIGGRSEPFVWSASLGADFRATSSFVNVQSGSMVTWGGGLGILLGEEQRLQVGPEITCSVNVTDLQKRTANVEWLGGARYRFTRLLEAGAGVGTGISLGVGTPDFRAVGLVAFSPEVARPVHDRDGDGIADHADACPDVAGPASHDPTKHGCPPPRDRDGDGILDDVDACPDAQGVPDPDPAKNGCPAPMDRDGDGVRDDVDACPDEKGPANPDPKKNGCPGDRDGDGINDDVDACPDAKGPGSPDPKKNGCPGDRDDDGVNDDVDACPDEKGPANEDWAKNGCPTDVRLTDNDILVFEQVQFDLGRTTIKPASRGLLDHVANVFKEHPEISKVEIQGHTDTAGHKGSNMLLSQGRAEAVMAEMVKRGVSPSRLTARGYGQSMPIAANVTSFGRAKNRRVDFKILQSSMKAPPATPRQEPPKQAPPKQEPPKQEPPKQEPPKPAPELDIPKDLP